MYMYMYVLYNFALIIRNAKVLVRVSDEGGSGDSG